MHTESSNEALRPMVRLPAGYFSRLLSEASQTRATYDVQNFYSPWNNLPLHFLQSVVVSMAYAVLAGLLGVGIWEKAPNQPTLTYSGRAFALGGFVCACVMIPISYYLGKPKDVLRSQLSITEESHRTAFGGLVAEVKQLRFYEPNPNLFSFYVDREISLASKAKLLSVYFLCMLASVTAGAASYTQEDAGTGQKKPINYFPVIQVAAGSVAIVVFMLAAFAVYKVAQKLPSLVENCMTWIPPRKVQPASAEPSHPSGELVLPV